MYREWQQHFANQGQLFYRLKKTYNIYYKAIYNRNLMTSYYGSEIILNARYFQNDTGTVPVIQWTNSVYVI